MKYQNISKILKNTLPNKAYILGEKELRTLTTFSAVALGIIALAGIASLALVAPNMLKLLNIYQN